MGTIAEHSQAGPSRDHQGGTVKVYENHYIGGAWVPSTGDKTIDVIDPATEEVIGQVPEGTAADVDAAVAAARDAFETWSTTPVDIRAKYLRDIGAALGAPVSYTHLTLPTTCTPCRSRWSRDH